jgi:predicted site-specific integrase-resolvase
LREAAHETGASLPALRRWYRQGLIESVTVPGTHGEQRLVDLDEVLVRAAASPNIGRRRRSTAEDRDAVIEALIEQVASLSMELSDLRERVEDLEG